MKIQGIKGMNWLMYRNYCKRKGLKADNFKSLEKFIQREYIKR